MYTKSDLLKAIYEIGIKPDDTLLIHSSMKAIGEVLGGADTVLDAFMEYLEPGLLLFPTHTWDQMDQEYSVYNPLTEPSCVGILTNLFRKRPGVIRSWHPTHSIAALGKDAVDFIEGEEQWDTPCSRKGCYGKLYDRKAKILFLGCSMNKNTFLHGVEEWNQIPNRLSDKALNLRILTPEGEEINRPVHGHHAPVKDISANYGKMKPAFLHAGIAKTGQIGDASCVLADAAGMADMTSDFLKRNPDLFLDDTPIATDWYL